MMNPVKQVIKIRSHGFLLTRSRTSFALAEPIANNRNAAGPSSGLKEACSDLDKQKIGERMDVGPKSQAKQESKKSRRNHSDGQKVPKVHALTHRPTIGAVRIKYV